MAVGEAVVDGHDLAVDEDEIGRLGGLLLAAVDDEEDREDGDEDDEESQAAVFRGHGDCPSRPGDSWRPNYSPGPPPVNCVPLFPELSRRDGHTSMEGPSKKGAPRD